MKYAVVHDGDGWISSICEEKYAPIGSTLIDESLIPPEMFSTRDGSLDIGKFRLEGNYISYNEDHEVDFHNTVYLNSPSVSKVWENASPTSMFPSQTISFNTRERIYRFQVDLWYHNYSENGHRMRTETLDVNSGIGAIFYITDQESVYRRVNIYDSEEADGSYNYQLEFEPAWRRNFDTNYRGEGNGYGIPLAVYAIRGGYDLDVRS